ncbi:unnamed protein product [Allacma fusca]|uniref:RNA helicase n=1 Tax=Allacma fusca TaxID=39272 RepID=A0A8J2P354_9HEXA|nr:unnamed protein product [Allacma fusca]
MKVKPSGEKQPLIKNAQKNGVHKSKNRKVFFNGTTKSTVNGSSKTLTNGTTVGNSTNRDDPSDGRNSLPVASCRKQLLHEFGSCSTFIVIGETGSGKTTQIPQYIFDGNMHKNKCIAITQPRRIAAISMAKRVADERQEDVGGTVGYSVRFEDTTSEKTRIKYMTDGMLLREAMVDSRLRKYSWIVLDEAHERTINTDVLFGVIKAAQQSRAGLKTKKRLKILIMSATMDVDMIKNFFPNSKVLYIQGREHNVAINYLTNPVEDKDYSNAVIKTVFQLHQTLPMKDHILAFLTGQDEIESAAHFMRKVISTNKFQDLEVKTLYASLSNEAQMEALSVPLPGVRRCILSTNVAETSLTIPGIRVVIDTGKVKTRFHMRGTNVDRLQVVPISQAQAWQRSGRAGRIGPGKCFRLFTAHEFEQMSQFPVPEIQRSNMAGVVLHLIKIGITSPLSFDWIDGPPKEAMQAAVEELLRLEAIKSSREPLELTESGNIMAKIPLDPPLARVLVNASRYSVVEPVLTVLSMLSSESLFLTNNGKRQPLKKRFCTPEGDLIAYLKIYREFKKTATKSSWCKMNGLNLR